VVVENISRHWAMRDGRSRLDAAIAAVAEVGNPTIVATLTVVAALLPMLFVSGLMGPYMAPIPANASAAMLFSFFVAMVVAPWLMLRLRREAAPGEGTRAEGLLGRLYRAAAAPLLRSRARAWIFLLLVGGATIAAFTLFYTEAVTVKLLPFDNKSELAVELNLPEGSSLEDSERMLFAAAGIVRGVPEVQSVQVYAGTAAPFNFNGLVRHYYMRQSPELGDLQINLSDKGDRTRSSHVIALDLRRRLHALGLPEGSTLQVVEVPPGPPVLATLLAEIYGADAKTRLATAEAVKTIFASVPYVVDVADSYGHPRPRLSIGISASNRATFTIRSSRCSAAFPSAIRIAARSATPSRSASACRSATSPGTSASPRRRCRPTRCRAARPWWSSARWCMPNARSARACCSAATGTSPRW
jgi:multidrug efflux pump subunit AcrB